MRDETKRCCNCRFFDDTMYDCHLNPPVFMGIVKDDEGLDSQWWAFPFIKRDWQDWCSHWQAADSGQTAEQRAVEIERLRIADAERWAIQWAADTLCVGWADLKPDDRDRSRKAADTLRSLLERTR